MSLSPEQHAEIAQLAQELVSRTALPAEAAWAATIALIALGWYLDRRQFLMSRSTSEPSRLFAWVSLLNGAVLGSLTAWACYYALDVGRIACIPGKRSPSCGGAFADAHGPHGAFKNLYSMYEHPLGFWLTFLVVAFFCVLSWMAFFWATRWLARWMRQ